MNSTAHSPNPVARLCARLKAVTSGRRFRPSPWGGLLALAVAAGCIQLGNWQHGKADRKAAAQALLDQRTQDGAIRLGGAAVDADDLRSRPVVVRGRFETGRQFLVDNRIQREQAGYHVITPLRIEGSDMRVLVNRGWIPASDQHADLPTVLTPDEPLELRGTVIVPGQRFFTLGPEPAGDAWQPVWQNLDLARFRTFAPWPLQPVVIQLDPASPAGFGREWPRPDERLERHLSYALQWYGFAASALLIWLALAWRRN
ncbi:SURF1 family protein [Zoogloea dura]|uniref:SURF1 family protein n=1 Tax=Zoogloea dura TaxID=2728840 RepID=UPI001F3B3D6F|nr:SURF1 family protein [Zoogloea dura]